MSEPRPATAADLDALLNLEKACFSKPWTKAQLASLVEDYPVLAPCREFALLIELAQQPAAYIGWQIVFDEATLLSIAVHPDFQRRGLATKLLYASLEQLRKYEVKRLLLEVSEHNTSAQAFYIKEGFQMDGVRKDYYGKAEAAWLMSRELV